MKPLLLRCFDSIAKDSGEELITEVNISVQKFLTALSSTPIDQFDKKLLEGTVSFTHFIEMVESEIPTATLKILYERKAAIVLKKDLLIPVLFSDGSYTFILIQVKNVAGHADKGQSNVLNDMEKAATVSDFDITQPFARVLFRLQATPSSRAPNTIPSNSAIILGFSHCKFVGTVRAILVQILDNTTDKLLASVEECDQHYVRLMFPIRYFEKQTPKDGSGWKETSSKKEKETQSKKRGHENSDYDDDDYNDDFVFTCLIAGSKANAKKGCPEVFVDATLL